MWQKFYRDSRQQINYIFTWLVLKYPQLILQHIFFRHHYIFMHLCWHKNTVWMDVMVPYCPSMQGEEFFEWDIMLTLRGIIYWCTSNQGREEGMWAQLWARLIRQKESLMKFLWSAFSRSPWKYILMKSKLSGLEGEDSGLLCNAL